MATALAFVALACETQGPERADTVSVEQARPNIVYIMADDLGYADLSSYGRTDYATPALDQLAAEGTRFAQAYAIAPVCTPTRVGLMTGRYPARTRIGTFEPLRTLFIDEGLEPTATMLPRRLQSAGYRTGMVGKWHLGRQPEASPGAHGFERSFSTLGGGTDYVSHRATAPGAPDGPYDLYQDGEEHHVEGYLTELFTEQAIAFLQSTEEPFFLNLEYNAPHWPWQQPGDPAYPEGADPVTHGGSPEIYAGMMGALDAGVARIVDTLDDLGYADNTIVIFTSDNGGERFSDMGELRGMKTQLWEGGIRVPAFVRWPGIIPGGITTAQVATTLDWTATMLAAAGVEPTPEWDGIDLLPHLRGEVPVEARTVFWRSNRWGLQHAVRQGDWKYLRVDEPHPTGRAPGVGEFLFNVSADPAETTNLAEQESAVLERLRSSYVEWEAGVLAPIEPITSPLL